MSEPVDLARDLVVTGGGSPSPDELAAIVAAVRTVAAEQAALAGWHVGPPAWTRAALREGVGGARAAAPTDLDLAPDLAPDAADRR